MGLVGISDTETLLKWAKLTDAPGQLCDYILKPPRFQTRPWASATILGLDVARKDLGLRAPAKWKKYQTALFPWQLWGSDPKGNAASPHFAALCCSLPSIACCAAAYARHIKTSGNREFRMMSPIRPRNQKNNLKGLLP
jgi:hypothetical protein